MIPSWWRTLWKFAKGSSKSTRRSRRGGARRRPTYQPWVEGFEERLVPSTFLSLLDTTGARGAIVNVPLSVANLQPDSGSGGNGGFGGGDIVLFYDTSVFTV